jgi:ATP-dependent Clp protease protease subunit
LILQWFLLSGSLLFFFEMKWMCGNFCFYYLEFGFFSLVSVNFCSPNPLACTSFFWDFLQITGAPIGPPPDLPSLLLHNRIVYIGMPLVPAVTELIIAELLYLNYESTDPITMYINSSGTTTASGEAVGFETEAFAIADVMKYVRPAVHTVALGQAFGAAAMLLAQGKRGYRFALPNATILLNQPKSQARGQASDIAIKAKEVQNNRRVMCELIASAAGKPVEEVMKDCSRVKYLQPDEAVAYGLVDQVIENGDKRMPTTPAFMNALQ